MAKPNQAPLFSRALAHQRSETMAKTDPELRMLLTAPVGGAGIPFGHIWKASLASISSKLSAQLFFNIGTTFDPARVPEL